MVGRELSETYPHKDPCTDEVILEVEHLSGNGPVNVAVTPSGYVTGFAYALNYYGEAVMDFTTHPLYTENAAELLRRTAAEFQGPQSPLLYLHVDDAERHTIALKAGFSLVATVPGRYSIYRTV